MVWRVLTPAEPSYQGKPLHEWLRGFDFGRGSPRLSSAQLAIHQIGTNSVPLLIHYLRYHDSAIKTRIILFTREYPLWSGHIDDAFLWNRRAALACGELGSMALPALPALAEAATNSQAPEQVLEALAKMFPKSDGVLMNLLATGNPLVRVKTAEILVEGLSYPELVLPNLNTLTNALAGPDFTAQMSVVTALSHSRTQHDLILPALLRSISDENLHPNVRCIAAAALGDFRIQPKIVVPALKQVLSDSNATVRAAVVNSLARLVTPVGPPVPPIPGATSWKSRPYDADSVIPALLQALQDSDASVRSSAADGLGPLAAESAEREAVVSALVNALRDSSKDVRFAAANSLGRTGLGRRGAESAQRETVVSALVTLLGDPNESVRWAAANSLRGLGAADRPEVAEMLDNVQDESPGNGQRRALRVVTEPRNPP
jgi:HEAT repeat protein